MEGTKLKWNKVFKEIILGKNTKDNLHEAVRNEDICPSSDTSLSKSDIFQNDLVKPVSSGAERTKKVIAESCLKHSSETPTVPLNDSYRKTKEVPEWEKVFKDILGDKPCQVAQDFTDGQYSPSPASPKARELLESTENDYFPPPVPYKPVKLRIFHPKRNPAFKSKKDKEAEEKVRKDFDSWRRFKKQTSQITLNDFDGAGINVFKYSSREKDFYSVPKQCHEKTNLNYTDDYKFSKTKQNREKKITLNDFDGAGINVFKYSTQQKALYSVPKQKGNNGNNIQNQVGQKNVNSTIF